jgi:hypothetical protein
MQDIVSYTPLTQQCEPEDIMNMLHTLFSRLDAVTSALGIFKVETIGGYCSKVTRAQSAEFAWSNANGTNPIIE